MMEVILTLVAFICSVIVVCLFAIICWYIVWKCCLSKFRFVRELLGGMSETPPASETRENKTRKSRKSRID